MSNLEKYLKQLFQNHIVRYVFAGGCTTVVNFVFFYLFTEVFNLSLNLGNFLAICLAILAAYVLNKGFVFCSKTNNMKDLLAEFFSFISARIFTMIIELVGVFLLVGTIQINSMIAKAIIQVVVLVLNYIFSKLVIFKEKEQKENEEKISFRRFVYENINYILSFCLPLLILLIVYIVNEITPFGGNSLSIVDSVHQYMPFFSEYYNKLVNSESILYSWNGALGFNFLGLWAYYLSSPLNFIMLLFKQEDINTALSLIVALKFALCSLSFSYLIGKKTSKHNPRIILFGLCYAFSNYMIGYYWNVMWVDCLILLPLIILGIDRLIQEDDGKLYCVSLFLCLFCNFYISFIICIFAVIWYLCYSHKSIKQFFKKGFIFAGYSLLAGGLAAIVLLPTYNNLMLTGSAKSKFPDASWYGNFIDLMNAQFSFIKPIKNDNFDGKVNLYCGLFAIFGAFLYLLNKDIKLREKLTKVGMLLLFVVSFNLNVLNYIWHGFHDQYGIPNRFSFLYIFVVLYMSAEALYKIKKNSSLSITISYVLCGILLVISYMFSEETLKIYIYLIAIGIFTFYFVVLFLYRNNKIKTKVFCWIVVAAVTIEIGANAICGFIQVGKVDIERYYGDKNTIAKIIEKYDSKEDFYRMDLNKTQMLDESVWHNLKGVGMFGSTVNGKVASTMGRFGFYSAPNEYLYKGATPFTNALFRVKYLLEREKSANITPHTFTMVDQLEEIEVYENNTLLPMGVMLEEQILDWDYSMQNPFMVQNNFVTSALGRTEEEGILMYDILPVVFEGENMQLENCTLTNGPSVHGQYTVTSEASSDKKVIFTVPIEQDNQEIYLYPVGNSIKKVTVVCNEEEYVSETRMSNTMYVGDFNAGDTLTITYELKDSSTGDMVIKCLLASLDRTVFEEVCDELSQQGLKDIQYTSASIRGKVTTTGGYLMMPIPYDPGWKAYVNGEKVETKAIGEAFLSIPLDIGTYEIEFKFVPSGLVAGGIITMFSIVIFIGTRYYRKKYVMKQK